MTEAGTGPSAREGFFARRALTAVGTIYLLLQLVLFSIHRAPGWDESVYFSQVTPAVKAMFFIPARARGSRCLSRRSRCSADPRRWSGCTWR